MTNKPRILTLVTQSLPATLYTCQWIPVSARLVVGGCRARGTGFLQVYEFNGTDLKLQSEAEPQHTIKCSAIDSSSTQNRLLITGNAKGELQLWDIMQHVTLLSTIPAHEAMIHAVTSFSKTEAGSCGKRLLATAGCDGLAKLWDADNLSKPLVTFTSEESQECWSVAFGNAQKEAEAKLLTGYSDGNLILLDVETGSCEWRTNISSGVVSATFDRPDIAMNKFVAVCMDSSVQAFDARTFHPQKGFAACKKELGGVRTPWGCSVLPQHRDICMVNCGDGTLQLFQYHYPDQRWSKDADSEQRVGVPGTLELLSSVAVTEQPVSSLSWNSEKTGLFCCTALDQCLRVGLVTKLHLY